MITYLNGTLTEKGPDCCIIEAAGVGYHLSCSTKAVKKMGECGASVKILTRQIIRENSWQLFGFAETAERELFDMLINVSGIGPKAAIALLSAFSVEQLNKAISAEDEKMLASVPGIGKKTAGRIIVELKEKTGWAPETAVELMEARDALVSLGYSLKEAGELLNGLEAATTEELLKKALQKA